MDLLNNKIILDELKKISIKYKLKILLLFGSRAKENWKENSDYDFAFIPSSNFNSDLEIKLFDDLMIILKNENIDL